MNGGILPALNNGSTKIKVGSFSAWGHSLKVTGGFVLGGGGWA